LFTQGKKEEGVGWYQSALRWLPTYADAHCNRATAYAALKRGAQVGREIEAHRQCYERGQPVRDPSLPPTKPGDSK